MNIFPLLRNDQNSQVIDMPVPSSFNDITTSAKMRDFVGWAWYFREFFVPISWLDSVRLARLYFLSGEIA